MQFIRIEADLICGSFYCPFTGQKIIGDEGYTPSKATLFAYAEDDSEFIGPVHESLETKKESIGNVFLESETLQDVEKGLSRLIDDEANILVIQLVDHPSSQLNSTITIVFNTVAVKDQKAAEV